MISFIICSIHLQKLEILLKSISATVSNVYEVISYDNRETNHSIAHVYNICASKSQYENLVFVHEDVQFFNQGWDKALLAALHMPKAGIVGLAGSQVLTEIPSYWHIYDQYIVNEKNLNTEEVVIIDGFFIAAKKAIFPKTSFDETISKYHCYDTDICLSALQNGYKNYVVTNVEFIHHSNGTYDESWVTGTFKVFEKHASLLPVYCVPTTNHSNEKKQAFVFFSLRIIYLKNAKISSKILYLLKLLKKSSPLHIFLPLLIKTVCRILWRSFIRN